MQEPERFSALRQRNPGSAVLRLPGLAVEERAFVGKISIRGRASDAAFISRFRDALGAEPPRPGAAVETDAATLLPLGPTEWLAVDSQTRPAARHPGTAALRDRLAAAGLVAVDVSSATAILRVSGQDLHPTMRRLAALAVHRMPAASVARSRIGKLAILVHVLASDCIDLLVARSLAQSFLEQIQDAAGAGL